MKESHVACEGLRPVTYECVMTHMTLPCGRLAARCAVHDSCYIHRNEACHI